jgi:hypothetical protein
MAAVDVMRQYLQAMQRGDWSTGCGFFAGWAGPARPGPFLRRSGNVHGLLYFRLGRINGWAD